jgi:2',3'-cyclic-nucleotide 2'-phosphodiesterase (5'-nucleotidase family)
MTITRKAGILLAAAFVLFALAFTGCSTDDGGGDEEPGPDWGKIASWNGEDAAVVLGTASADISGLDIRYKETPLGNLIADGIAEYARYTSAEKVDFAMLNGQNVQNLSTEVVDADGNTTTYKGIPKGDITLASLTSGSSTLGDTLFLVTYTGAEIEAIINVFVNSPVAGQWRANCVVLVSKGVSYTVSADDTDLTNPPHVTGIKINGAPIDSTKTYRVAVGNFIAGQNAGGGTATSGGPANFVSYGGTDQELLGDTLKQAVAKYILAMGTVNPKTENRIIGIVPSIQ